MQSILGLFEETLNDLYEGAGKRNKYIKNINIVPDLYCPEVGSKTHDDDMDKIRWYYENKSMNLLFILFFL